LIATTLLFMVSELYGTEFGASQPHSAPADAIKFMQLHCYDCHQGDSAEAGLDLTFVLEPLSPDSANSNREPIATWIQSFDRVAAGEMPPRDAEQPSPAESKAFLTTSGRWLRDHQAKEAAQFGRVQGHRLNNLQLERSLHDLLGVDTPLAKNFSDEPRTGGFTTVADGQAMSMFQLEQHLNAVDNSLREAVRRAASVPDETSTVFHPKEIARVRANSRTREPEMREGLAITWASRLEFYGRLPVTIAKQAGWYRFHITASSLKQPKDHGVWCAVRSGRCVSGAPLLFPVGIFEATETPNEWSFEAWLEQDHMLEVRPMDSALPVAKFAGGQVGTGEGESQDVPGVAFHQIKMERIHRGPSNEEVRNRLFGDLKLRESNLAQHAKKKWDKSRRSQALTEVTSIDLISSDPKQDAASLMTSFASRTFRRPVQSNEIEAYIHKVHQELDDGKPLSDSLVNGYRSLLCSPHFLYFQESPGKLNDYAIASRLSYFLWQSMPDETLMKLAAKGELNNKETLVKQTRRMLDDPRGADFVDQFANQWLDLCDIDFTQPDPRLYRQFDVTVQQSMLDETRTFLRGLLNENRSIKQLIDSDYTYLNSRLARFYDIDGVSGDAMRKVELKDKHRRGGILTQGAILKVTANGTTTSPVIRGVWIAERLLGDHVPPPPKNVPAIEPDIRGATSIRDMLEKHRSDDACAVCHVKMDPPGFALENYDPSGQWRDAYGSSKNAKPTKKIDAGYVLADGREFDNIDDFRKLILAKPEKVAACVAEKLVTYGTGAKPRFVDRDVIEEIAEQSKDSDFGFRTIVENVVCSDLFLNK